MIFLIKRLDIVTLLCYNVRNNVTERDEVNDALISKKDLLGRYGISYGALYRWKRMGLIPEEWFIKKATVTGQETFFPKELICARVETILEKKDDCSLEQLASHLKGEASDAFLVLHTVYGEKKLCLSEVSSIRLTDSKGKEKDLTDYIKHFWEEHEE